MQQFLWEMTDWTLAWLLQMPRDMGLVVVSILTGTVLLALRRRLVTPQQLTEIRQDLATLKDLAATAREVGDDEVVRIRTVKSLVRGRLVRLELPYLVVAAPILVLVTSWMQARFDRLPLVEDEWFGLQLNVRQRFENDVGFVVPKDELQVKPSWIQRLDSGEAANTAQWQLRMQREFQGDVVLRWQDETLRHPIVVGQQAYASPTVIHTEGVWTVVELPEYRPFGLPSRILSVPSWSVVMLVISLLIVAAPRMIARGRDDLRR